MKRLGMKYQRWNCTVSVYRFCWESLRSFQFRSIHSVKSHYDHSCQQVVPQVFPVDKNMLVLHKSPNVKGIVLGLSEPICITFIIVFSENSCSLSLLIRLISDRRETLSFVKVSIRWANSSHPALRKKASHSAFRKKKKKKKISLWSINYRRNH